MQEPRPSVRTLELQVIYCVQCVQFGISVALAKAYIE